jgi:hypothetical protein
MCGSCSPTHASAPNGDDRPMQTVREAARYLEEIPGRLCRGRRFRARVIPSIQEHIEIQLCQARCSHPHRHNALCRADVRTTRDAGGSRLWARFPCRFTASIHMSNDTEIVDGIPAEKSGKFRRISGRVPQMARFELTLWSEFA